MIVVKELGFQKKSIGKTAVKSCGTVVSPRYHNNTWFLDYDFRFPYWETKH